MRKSAWTVGRLIRELSKMDHNAEVLCVHGTDTDIFCVDEVMDQDQMREADGDYFYDGEPLGDDGEPLHRAVNGDEPFVFINMTWGAW